jgi:hypothetical protein
MDSISRTNLKYTVFITHNSLLDSIFSSIYELFARKELSLKLTLILYILYKELSFRNSEIMYF